MMIALLQLICVFCVQLGAGTALPTLILFDYFLRHPSPAWRAISFLLADYNTSVLETTTVPNLLLTWHFAHSTESLPRVGDLEITEDLLDHFLDALSDKAIFIEGISGAWGDKFCSLMQFEAAFNGSNHRPDVDIEILCLASETIYSPSSIRAFTEVLIRTLRGVENLGGKAKALIAAKCVYFGVGGGVDEFLKVLGGVCGRATPVWESTDPGVGRVILEMMTDDTLLDKDGLPPFPRR